MWEVSGTYAIRKSWYINWPLRYGVLVLIKFIWKKKSNQAPTGVVVRDHHTVARVVR